MKHQQSQKSISKFLSLVLRHKPETIGIKLDPQGWISVEVLLQKLAAHGKSLDLLSLESLVANNDKQRFAFSPDKKYIRANQGHSIQIELNYHPITPPPLLFHGTATRFLTSILEQGLLKQQRHHVHLSSEMETAKKVGLRHGKLVVLKVQSEEMQKAGYDFFKSDNGVWLTDHVPPQYLEILS